MSRTPHDFRITGLSAAPFRALFGLSDAALAARHARRMVVDAKPGYPDRIALRDADVGETVLLVNHPHLPDDGPYRSSHAVFVVEGEARTYDATGEVPAVLRSRVLSLRGFDAQRMMVEADLVDGRDVEALIARFFANPDVAFIHVHYAKRGCYACRVDRIATNDQNSSASSPISTADPARAVRNADAVSGSSFAK